MRRTRSRMRSGENTPMSFEISKTPTLEAVATGDEARLAADLKARTAAGLELAEQQDSVRDAAQAHEAAREHLAKFRKAERALNQFAKDIDARVAAQREVVLDGLIDAAASDAKPEYKALNDVVIWETRGRMVTRAIERLVETLIPVAELTS